ncbi:MAG: sigma-70 family RNA polymerase sigma factor [Planctomycetes bacterium]|nr:sigma-70 family RNA polymerase sigma factor [Planctomycetota bacterium]MBI3833474.1 sigma-70 family RNA polymerase sigma factor [Planctomycetota bacterium]
MSGTNVGDVTKLLQAANTGDAHALSELMRAVNDDLRGVAERHMRRAFGPKMLGVTLQPTAVVNEAYLKLIKQRNKYDNRGHFFAIATKVLIRVLKDYQTRRRAAKRGGGWVRVSLDPERARGKSETVNDVEAIDVDVFDAALEKLERLDARKAEVVKLRMLWGLSIEEAATTLNVGHATVDRDWQFARAWLGKELRGE